MTMRRLTGISARNQLHGIVEDVQFDGLMAQVRLRLGEQVITAIITRDAALDLGLEKGEAAIAVVKATEVIIAKEESR